MISQSLFPAAAGYKGCEEGGLASTNGLQEPKVNFDKSEGLRLGAWTGSNTLPGPFHWSDGPVRILGVWVRARPPTGAKLVGSTS